jgi:YtfJ family uncharacterized protein
MKKLILLFLLVCSMAVQAETCIQPGQALSQVTLDRDAGRLFIDGKDPEKVNVEPWYSGDLTGQKYIIYHLAARMGIDKVNQHFLDALHKLEQEDHHEYTQVTILNVDDVTFGMTGLAKSTFAKNKVKYGPEEYLVQDTASVTQETWCIKRKSSTVIALDEKGVVVYFHIGALPEAAVVSVVDWLKTGEFTAPVIETKDKRQKESSDFDEKLP